MIELIDVLDAGGRPTGRRKTKTEVHRDGDWHRAAHVWIVTPDLRVLLQRRSLRKENHPGLWDVSAAGHLSAGETSSEAAVREVREELGLVIHAADLRFLCTLPQSCALNRGTYLDNEFHDIFLLQHDVVLDQLVLQPEEVDEAVLVRPERILALDERVPHPGEYELVLEHLRS